MLFIGSVVDSVEVPMKTVVNFANAVYNGHKDTNNGTRRLVVLALFHCPQRPFAIQLFGYQVFQHKLSPSQSITCSHFARF